MWRLGGIAIHHLYYRFRISESDYLMPETSRGCKTVAKGGVGESGASSFLSHAVTGTTSKIMVLRNVNTSLCGNTGAIGVLVADDQPVASGDLSAVGASIQAEAAPGVHIAAVIHTVPRFNGITCVRLGELTVQLNECELELLAEGADVGQAALISRGLPTREWYAWNNLMPPKPDDFHVVGEVQVPNPGVDVLLVPKEPQGINPRILLLDLIAVQKPGIWPQVLTWKSIRYDKVNATYDGVQIFLGATLIADLPVDIVQ